MSHAAAHEPEERKTVSSYVFGFLLSLIFTLLPYHLVVQHIIRGRTLLLTILGFAFVQLLVQVVFFLHLGRGPKQRWNLYFLIATVSIIMIVVGGSIVIINNLHYNLAATDQTKRLIDGEAIYQVGGNLTGACQGRHTNYRVGLKNGSVEPLLTVAGRCDTLTFTNYDKANIELIFGTVRLPTVYAGRASTLIQKEHSTTITLSELGTYQFYERSRPSTVGSFAVVVNN